MQMLFAPLCMEGIRKLPAVLAVLLPMLVDLVERQRQEALRRLLESAVEDLVDLVPDRHRGDADANEPKCADKHDE